MGCPQIWLCPEMCLLMKRHTSYHEAKLRMVLVVKKHTHKALYILHFQLDQIMKNYSKGGAFLIK